MRVFLQFGFKADVGLLPTIGTSVPSSLAMPPTVQHRAPALYAFQLSLHASYHLLGHFARGGGLTHRACFCSHCPSLALEGSVCLSLSLSLVLANVWHNPRHTATLHDAIRTVSKGAACSRSLFALLPIFCRGCHHFGSAFRYDDYVFLLGRAYQAGLTQQSPTPLGSSVSIRGCFANPRRLIPRSPRPNSLRSIPVILQLIHLTAPPPDPLSGLGVHLQWLHRSLPVRRPRQDVHATRDGKPRVSCILLLTHAPRFLCSCRSFQQQADSFVGPHSVARSISPHIGFTLGCAANAELVSPACVMQCGARRCRLLPSLHRICLGWVGRCPTFVRLRHSNTSARRFRISPLGPDLEHRTPTFRDGKPRILCLLSYDPSSRRRRYAWPQCHFRYYRHLGRARPRQAHVDMPHPLAATLVSFYRVTSRLRAITTGRDSVQLAVPGQGTRPSIHRPHRQGPLPGNFFARLLHTGLLTARLFVLVSDLRASHCNILSHCCSSDCVPWGTNPASRAAPPASELPVPSVGYSTWASSASHTGPPLPCSWSLCQAWARIGISPFAGVRIGEASHPGPAHQATFKLAVVNPTAIHRKEQDLADLHADVLCISETSALEHIQKAVAKGMSRRGYRTTFGAPVAPHTAHVDRPDFVRGLAGGVAIMSQLPMRPSPTPLPRAVYATTRLVESIIRVGALEFRLVTIYGIPQCHANALDANAFLLDSALQRVCNSRVPAIIAGDFNCDVTCLPQWGQFNQLGFVEAFQAAKHRLHVDLPPTCKSSTRFDTALLSPMLVEKLCGAQVMLDFHAFDSHAPLLLEFEIPHNAPTVRRWRLPRPFSDFTVPTDKLQAAYEERAGAVEESLSSAAVVADPGSIERAFCTWAQVVESSVDDALHRFHLQCPWSQQASRLPRAYRGRCQPVHVFSARVHVCPVRAALGIMNPHRSAPQFSPDYVSASAGVSAQCFVDCANSLRKRCRLKHCSSSSCMSGTPLPARRVMEVHLSVGC